MSTVATLDHGAASRMMGPVAARRLTPSDGVQAVRDILTRVDAADVGDRPSSELAELIRSCDTIVNQVHALKLSAIAAANRARVGSGAGMSSTAAWVKTTTRTDGGSAAGQVSLATALDEGLPVAGGALSSGAISTAHASIIASTLAGLPASVTGTEREQIETRLTAAAYDLPPGRLRVLARRALAYAGRPTDEVDTAHDRQLRSQEERAYAAATLTLHDHADGTTSGRFVVPALAGAILRKVVQQLASPRRAGATGPEGTGGAMAARQRSHTFEAGAGMDWAHRNGQAFTALLEHLPTDKLPLKTAATIIATIPLEQLTRKLGAAGLDTGGEQSASGLRRLACAAGLVPAVMGGESQVLDLGRTKRLFTEAHRTALATRYDACAAHGCDRPYAWCELHHVHPWSGGGETNLENAIPLCSWHHHRIHDAAFSHRITYERNRHAPVEAHAPPGAEKPHVPPGANVGRAASVVTFHRRP